MTLSYHPVTSPVYLNWSTVHRSCAARAWHDGRRCLVEPCTRRAPLTVVAAGIALVSCIGGDDGGNDTDDGGAATLAEPDTFPLRPAEATIPGVTTDDTSAIADVVADATVTADELIDAYERYVGCLADGGGAGRYAYDIELRTGLVVEWTITEDDPTDLDRNVLSATCSARYLGTLTSDFERANPAAEDLDSRRSDSIAACIEPISPEAAANVPAEVTIGTADGTTNIGELQLDPASLDPETLGASPEDTRAVSACIASIGAEWHPFG